MNVTHPKKTTQAAASEVNTRGPMLMTSNLDWWESDKD